LWLVVHDDKKYQTYSTPSPTARINISGADDAAATAARDAQE
jgi:hypothetical protein